MLEFASCLEESSDPFSLMGAKRDTFSLSIHKNWVCMNVLLVMYLEDLQKTKTISVHLLYKDVRSGTSNMRDGLNLKDCWEHSGLCCLNIPTMSKCVIKALLLAPP